MMKSDRKDSSMKQGFSERSILSMQGIKKDSKTGLEVVNEKTFKQQRQSIAESKNSFIKEMYNEQEQSSSSISIVNENDDVEHIKEITIENQDMSDTVSPKEFTQNNKVVKFETRILTRIQSKAKGLGIDQGVNTFISMKEFDNILMIKKQASNTIKKLEKFIED